MTAGGSSAPSVSVNNSSTSVPDQTVTATATTRDDTPILDLVLKRAKAQV
jgi:galactose-1-phosphate uridylyltransferase